MPQTRASTSTGTPPGTWLTFFVSITFRVSGFGVCAYGFRVSGFGFGRDPASASPDSQDRFSTGWFALRQHASQGAHQLHPLTNLQKHGGRRL